jgi:hypothetical protein
MSWLPLTSDEQASPEVKSTYAFLGENWASCRIISSRWAATRNFFRIR